VCAAKGAETVKGAVVDTVASVLVTIERDEPGSIAEGGPDVCVVVVGLGCLVPHLGLAMLNADLAAAGCGHLCDEGVLFRSGGAEGGEMVIEDGGQAVWGLGFDVEERLPAAAAMAEGVAGGALFPGGSSGARGVGGVHAGTDETTNRRHSLQPSDSRLAGGIARGRSRC
jgi:hypothetical protein